MKEKGQSITQNAAIVFPMFVAVPLIPSKLIQSVDSEKKKKKSFKKEE